MPPPVHVWLTSPADTACGTYS